MRSDWLVFYDCGSLWLWNSLSTFSHVPKSKVLRDRNHKQSFSVVCKSHSSWPSLVFVPTTFKSRLKRHTYGQYCSELPEFPVLNPSFSTWESTTYSKGGFSEASAYCSSGSCIASIHHFHAPCWAPLLQPAQQVGMESGQRTVWKKETRDRIKVLKMRPGTQDLLGQEPCSSEPHHSYLVSWQAQSICCATMKSASCLPSHISHFID